MPQRLPPLLRSWKFKGRELITGGGSPAFFVPKTAVLDGRSCCRVDFLSVLA
jgi:hypothetical protein